MASPPEATPTTPSESAPPPPAETPPPQPSSPPPPIANEPPPQSPPPATTTPSSPSPPPPAGATPPTNSQSPPTNDSGSSSPPSSNSPPRTRDSPSRGYSPPAPGDGDSESDNTPSRSGGRSSDSGSSSNGQDNSFSNGAVAAIVVGGVVIIALLVVCLICSRRKKRRPQYYLDPGQTPNKVGNQQYYNAPPQWNSPKPADHVVKVPPPGVSSGWGTTPPPPPANNSGEGEYSSGYSGPRHTPMPPSPNMAGFGTQSQFSYEDLAYATGGFHQENLLGQGGFGYVHKGILPGGKVVAVKSLKSGSGQGEREFQAEVEIISRVHHRHLVSLVGYCIADGHTMLVYEYVPNKTMEFHLHGKDQPVMEWSTRLRIALGSAKGLAYLHEDCHPRIIHRDIKAANILIDNNFEAMVADFGLAKLTTDTNTHVSTRVMGTFGYLAPEYASSGKLSEKSDVFSFGVMLLELITGRRPVDPHDMMEDSLVDWARPLLARALEESIYGELLDPRLEDKFIPSEMARMAACAAASIRHSARRRPRMSQIVRTLEGASSLEDLNEVGKQAHGAPVSKPTTEIYDTRAYDADMMKFRKMVMMPSPDFNGSEYGGTSEYGLNPSSSSSDSSRPSPGIPSPDLRRP